MRLLAALTIAGLGTYVIRASFIAASGLAPLRMFRGRALDAVAPAAFAALLVVNVRGQLDVGSVDPARIVALAVAAIVAWRTRNVPLVMLAGFAALAAGRLSAGW